MSSALQVGTRYAVDLYLKDGRAFTVECRASSDETAREWGKMQVTPRSAIKRTTLRRL